MIVRRVEALGKFLDTDDGKNLLAGTKRASNILAIEEKRDKRTFDGAPNPALYGLPEEKALAKAIDQAKSEAGVAVAKEDFAALLRLEPTNADGHAGLGYLAALRKSATEAQREAVHGLLNGAGDYLAMHNLAMAYATGRGVEKDEREAVRWFREAASKGTLKEVWGTGTAAVISPVGELAFQRDRIVVNGGRIGELTQRLYDTIVGIQYGTAPDPRGWTVTV